MYRRSNVLLLVLVALVFVGCATSVVHTKLDPARPQSSNSEIFKTLDGPPAMVVVLDEPVEPPLPQDVVTEASVEATEPYPQEASEENVVKDVEVIYSETPVAMTSEVNTSASAKPTVSMRPYKRSNNTTDQLPAVKPVQQMVAPVTHPPSKPLRLAEDDAMLAFAKEQAIEDKVAYEAAQQAQIDTYQRTIADLNEVIAENERTIARLTAPSWYERYGIGFLLGLIAGALWLWDRRRLASLVRSLREFVAEKQDDFAEALAQKDAFNRELQNKANDLEKTLGEANRLIAELQRVHGLTQQTEEKPQDEPPKSLIFQVNLLPSVGWEQVFWEGRAYTPENIKRAEELAERLGVPPPVIDQTREMTPDEVSGVTTESVKPHPLTDAEVVGSASNGSQPRDELGRFASTHTN